MPNTNTYAGYHYPSVSDVSGISGEDIRILLNKRTLTVWYTGMDPKYNVVHTYTYQPAVQNVEEVEINDG